MKSFCSNDIHHEKHFEVITHRRNGTINKLPNLFKLKSESETMEMRSDVDLPGSAQSSASILSERFCFCCRFDATHFVAARMMQKFIREIQVSAYQNNLIGGYFMHEISFSFSNAANQAEQFEFNTIRCRIIVMGFETREIVVPC